MWKWWTHRSSREVRFLNSFQDSVVRSLRIRLLSCLVRSREVAGETHRNDGRGTQFRTGAQTGQPNSSTSRHSLTEWIRRTMQQPPSGVNKQNSPVYDTLNSHFSLSSNNMRIKGKWWTHSCFSEVFLQNCLQFSSLSSFPVRLLFRFVRRRVELPNKGHMPRKDGRSKRRRHPQLLKTLLCISGVRPT